MQPEYVLKAEGDRLILRNYKGEIYSYPQMPPMEGAIQSRNPAGKRMGCR